MCTVVLLLLFPSVILCILFTSNSETSAQDGSKNENQTQECNFRVTAMIMHRFVWKIQVLRSIKVKTKKNYCILPKNANCFASYKKKKTDQNSLFYRQTWEISWLRFTESLRVVRKHSQKGDYFL